MVAPEPEIDLEEVLMYFPGLEDVVTTLVQNHIPFDTEGGFELKENDIIIAEAAIKIDGKDIVIDDFTDREDQIELFENHGFKVFAIETLVRQHISVLSNLIIKCTLVTVNCKRLIEIASNQVLPQ